jgi:hypothetical protein
MVRGGARECFCDALKELQAFSAARDDKTTDDRTRTANGGFSLTSALRTDKLDKRPRGSAEGWGAEDVVGEIIRRKSGAGINFRLYRHAPAVEAALTLPAAIDVAPKEGG